MANQRFAAALITQLVQSGVGHIAVSPGGRSAPIAMAVAAVEAGAGAQPGSRQDSPGERTVSVSIHVDERSAAFYALGWSRGSGRPSALVCTSGSAPAHFLPAVMEAHYARVPLILLTADRPPELRETGAWQAADQPRLYGDYVRWRFEAPAPSGQAGEDRLARSLGARAVAESYGERPGPVHLNLPFREPLVAPESSASEARPSLAGDTESDPYRGFRAEDPARSPDSATLDAFAARLAQVGRGLIVAGRDPVHPWPGAAGAADLPEAILRLASVLRWPVLAEATGGARRQSSGDALVLSGYDAYLRWSELQVPRPELILRFGGSPVWKHVSAYLDAAEADRVLVDHGATWDDPGRRGGLRLLADPVATARGLTDRLMGHESNPDPDWIGWWRRADATVTAVLAETLDAGAAGTTLGLPRAIQTALRKPAVIGLANSMAVRDFESFSLPAEVSHYVYANRGVAGIDGTVSTAAGVATGARRAGVLLTGDLALVHDAAGLMADASDGLAVVVANDAGGGIFRYLPMADSPAFARFFRTPSEVDIESLARAYGRPHVRVDTPAEVTEAVAEILERSELGVVEVLVDMDANTRAHREVWETVRRRLDGSDA